MIPVVDDIRDDPDGRAWWRTWLGGDRDPEGSFDIGSPESAGTGTRTMVIRLASYGAVLEAVLLAPDVAGPYPTIVVPFYEAETVMGHVTSRTRAWGEEKVRGHAYGRHLVERGFAVLAVPWWFEQMADQSAQGTSLNDRYGPSAALHARLLPMTGLGRGVADLVLAVDALLTVPYVDPGRIGAFGHSLGAKLALHLAAIDTRICATVAHEPGLGFAHSNWSDPWYLGSHIPAGRDQDEVLSLVAPRAFLLAGGGDSDGWHNSELVERARPAWNGGGGLQTLYHDTGHAHPDHVLAACYSWLEAHLGGAEPVLPERNRLT